MKSCLGTVIVGFDGFQINGMGFRFCFFVSLIADMQACLGRVIAGSEGLQIHENWGLDGPKIMKNHGLEVRGGSLGAFWPCLAKLWRGFLRKLSPGEAQNRLRERQVGERAAQVGPCWR